MDFLRRYVFHNLGLKLLSLVIAVLLWMAVAREPMAEVAITVPIEFQNAPDNLEISSESIPQVQVRERGPSGVVHDLGPAEVHAVIDLRSTSPGEHTYDLSPNKIRAPRDVQTLQVIPSQFRISFDKRATKTVKVQARVIGTTAPGYSLQDVKVEPSTVTLAGPEKRVDAPCAAERPRRDDVLCAGVHRREDKGKSDDGKETHGHHTRTAKADSMRRLPLP